MTQKSNLDSVYIAAPCNANWNDMHGDDRVRMYTTCSKNVYNVSDMTKAEAEDFLTERGVSACMRLFRREDGTTALVGG